MGRVCMEEHKLVSLLVSLSPSYSKCLHLLKIVVRLMPETLGVYHTIGRRVCLVSRSKYYPECESCFIIDEFYCESCLIGSWMCLRIVDNGSPGLVDVGDSIKCRRKGPFIFHHIMNTFVECVKIQECFHELCGRASIVNGSRSRLVLVTSIGRC
jgi:hypothetical protein